MIQAERASRSDTRFWNRLARKYARSPVKDPDGYEHTLRRVGGLLGANDQVLELGCGTGTTALRLAPLVGRYVATDCSTEMVAIANERLGADARDNLAFDAVAVEALSAPEGSFDAVLAFNVLHLVEELDQCLARARGLLRPGGLFVSKTACIRELNLAFRCAIPLMKLVGQAPQRVLTLGEEELLAAITRAGFSIEAVERHGAKGKDVRPFVVARRPAG